MERSLTSPLLVWMLLSVVSLTPLFGAETTGSVVGYVQDTAGGRVAGATVELVNAYTSALSRQETDGAGRFMFNLVDPGRYNLRGYRDGFKTVTVTGVLVRLNRTTKVILRLEVGQITTVIEVSPPETDAETVSSQVSTNIGRKLITDLPSATRNPLSLASAAPGVILSNAFSQVNDALGTTANVNGLRRSANVFYLNGSDNTGAWRNTSLQFPNPEAVEEVQVSTATTSAEIGKQPGGIFNVITKSGTNALHGAAFYFFRDEALNANSWDRNRVGAPRTQENVNQLGGTLGGPIRCSRTFFFGSYMFYRQENPRLQNNVQFPTDAAVQGDFSAFSRLLYDPDSGMPLAGNQIPSAKQDPVAANLLNLVPKVSRLGERFVWDYVDTIRNHEALGKFDHSLTTNQHLMASYMTTRGNTRQFAPFRNNVPAWGPQISGNYQNTFAAKHLWTGGANWVVQTSVSMAQLAADRDNVTAGRDLSDLGADWNLVQEGARKFLPQVIVADGFQTNVGTLGLLDQGNLRIGLSASWNRGAHNVKFGAESQQTRVRQLDDSAPLAINFDGRATSPPEGQGPSGVGTFGYALADLVSGRATTFQVRGVRDYRIGNWSHYFFIQDEWRISRRLTLTPGLRYEFYQPPVEASGRSVAYVAGHRSSLYPNAPEGLAFQGDRGIETGFYKQDRNNFAPRLGLAWDLRGDGRTALRAGVGIYYAFPYLQLPMINAETTPFDPSAHGGDTTGLVDLWSSSRSVRYTSSPTPFRRDVGDFEYPSRIIRPLSYDSGFKMPYTTQWTLSLEHVLSAAVVLQVGYVANRGFAFQQFLEGNLPVWNPGASLSNLEDRRPISGYSTIDQIHARARSWYDGLQTALDIRGVRGLRGRVIYSYGKALAVDGEDVGMGGARLPNPASADGEKAEVSLRQAFRAFYVYELPFALATRGIFGSLFGGWEVSGSVSVFSGSPINVTLGEDWNFDGRLGDRPDALGAIHYTGGTKDQRMSGYFDTSAFARPAVRNAFGSLGRNAVIGPGSWTADLALLKTFALSESQFLQLRLEAYEFLNHNNLSNPNTTLSSRDFGRIINRFGNRTMQLGVRYVF